MTRVAKLVSIICVNKSTSSFFFLFKSTLYKIEKLKNKTKLNNCSYFERSIWGVYLNAEQSV